MLLLVLGIRKDCKFRTWKVFGVWQKRGARGRLEIPMDTEAKRKRRGKQVSSRGHALVRECGVCERPAEWAWTWALLLLPTRARGGNARGPDRG